MSDLNKKVLDLLSEQIGVEPDDINFEDSLTEDLHMSGADLSNLSEKISEEFLSEKVFDARDAKTVSQLIEKIQSEEEI